MPRTPSPELLSFLLREFYRSSKTLGQVLASPSLSADIKTDLEEAIKAHSPDKMVRDVAQPIVLCLFDNPGQGKSSFGHLLKTSNLKVFETDWFVVDLAKDWNTHSGLRRLAMQYAPRHIDHFIRDVQRSEPLGRAFVELMFDSPYKFNITDPVSIIEGFLYWKADPNPAIRLDRAVRQRLMQDGYVVWDGKRQRL